MVKHYLIHYGVKGMQWGVRNGPPYPIEDSVLSKGTELSSVQIKGKTDKEGDWKYTYNSNDQWDRSVYEGPFSQYLKMRGRIETDNAIESIKYQVVKDLKMPTSVQRINEFSSIFKDKGISDSEKSSYLREILDHNQTRYEMGLKHEPDLLDRFSMKPSDITGNKQLRTSAYRSMVSMLDEPNYYSLAKIYRNRISSKFDAMVDDNNVNVYNKVHDPIIVFNVENSLMKIGSKTISNKQINENVDRVRKGMIKDFTIN